MFRTLAASALACVISAAGAFALDFKITASNLDEDRHSYELGLAQLALSKADGDHTLEIINPGKANQTRLLAELAKGDAPFNLIFSGVNQERYDTLTIVPIPLQRGLLGHRILITNGENAGALKSVETFDDLKKLTLGSGTGWPDTEILRHAGLNVNAASYQNLFTMTEKGRVQGYARGVAEPFNEVAQRADSHPGLEIDDTVMIVYPFDMFFFVAPGDQERADVLQQGLQRAYDDGSFMEYFNNHPRIQEVFEQAQIDQRVRFDIENPLLPAEIANLPDHLWHGRSNTSN